MEKCGDKFETCNSDMNCLNLMISCVFKCDEGFEDPK